jgi:tetratricopeptide (TPR) repeat protein
MKSEPVAMQNLLKYVSAILFLVAVSGWAMGQKPSAAAVPKEEQALLDAGQAAFQQGHFEEAIRLYNKELVLSARSPRSAALAYFRLGNVFMAQRKFDRAVADLQQALKLDPNYAEAHNNLGEALGESRQFNRALESFKRAIDLDPKLLRARYNIGITYGRLNNLQYAEFVFRLLVRDHPDYDLGYDGLAVTLAKSGRASEAVPFHQKAISLSPNEPSYYYNLALSYLILGDTPKALEQQKKLQALAPEIAEYLASVIIKKQMR